MPKYTPTELKAIAYHCQQHNVKIQISAWPHMYFKDDKGTETKEYLPHLLDRYKNKKKEERNNVA